MGEHDFCRAFLASVMVDVRKATTATERRAAWVWKSGRHVEFHGPGDFFWHHRACCLWCARADGWRAWLEKAKPASTTPQTVYVKCSSHRARQRLFASLTARGGLDQSEIRCYRHPSVGMAHGVYAAPVGLLPVKGVIKCRVQTGWHVCL